MARQIGAAVKSSAFQSTRSTQAGSRAVETGKLLSGKDVRPVDALTDSGAEALLRWRTPPAERQSRTALRELVNAAPKAGTNTSS